MTPKDVRTMKDAVFLAALRPDGSMPGFGRLPCPHCGDLHLNPEDGSSLWTLPQVKALAAMQAARVCAECGNPSTVFVAADNGRSGEG
jgi:ribosomal protein S27E